MNPCEMTNPPRPLSPSDYEVIEMPKPDYPSGFEKLLKLVELKKEHNALWLDALRCYYYMLDGDSSQTPRLAELLKTLHGLKDSVKKAQEETDADDSMRFLVNQMGDFYDRIVSRMNESVCAAPAAEESPTAISDGAAPATPAPSAAGGSPLEHSP